MANTEAWRMESAANLSPNQSVPTDREIALSQAISAKRIADALDRLTFGDNTFAGVLEHR